MMQYRGYRSTLEYDAEDGVFYGEVVCVRDVISFQSDTREGLEREFRISIDDYLAFCAENGRRPDTQLASASGGAAQSARERRGAVTADASADG